MNGHQVVVAVTLQLRGGRVAPFISVVDFGAATLLRGLVDAFEDGGEAAVLEAGAQSVGREEGVRLRGKKEN